MPWLCPNCQHPTQDGLWRVRSKLYHCFNCGRDSHIPREAFVASWMARYGAWGYVAGWIGTALIGPLFVMRPDFPYYMAMFLFLLIGWLGGVPVAALVAAIGQRVGERKWAELK